MRVIDAVFESLATGRAVPLGGWAADAKEKAARRPNFLPIVVRFNTDAGEGR